MNSSVTYVFPRYTHLISGSLSLRVEVGDRHLDTLKSHDINLDSAKTAIRKYILFDNAFPLFEDTQNKIYSLLENFPARINLKLVIYKASNQIPCMHSISLGTNSVFIIVSRYP